MIHYERIQEIADQLHAMENDVDDHLSTEATVNRIVERLSLENELKKLKQEQEDYRDGYDAGREYHMGDGVMRDEWLGRFGAFRRGFDAAGDDS